MANVDLLGLCHGDDIASVPVAREIPIDTPPAPTTTSAPTDAWTNIMSKITSGTAALTPLVRETVSTVKGIRDSKRGAVAPSTGGGGSTGNGMSGMILPLALAGGAALVLILLLRRK